MNTILELAEQLFQKQEELLRAIKSRKGRKNRKGMNHRAYLAIINAGDEGITVTKIGEAIDMAFTNVYRYVHALVAKGHVEVFTYRAPEFGGPLAAVYRVAKAKRFQR